MSIVSRIKNEAKRNDKTMTSVAKKVGLSAGAISKWDENTPSSEKLYAVATELNCSMEFLLHGKKDFKIDTLSPEEKDWLKLHEKIIYEISSKEIQNECIHFIKGYIQAFIDIEKTEVPNK